MTGSVLGKIFGVNVAMAEMPGHLDYKSKYEEGMLSIYSDWKASSGSTSKSLHVSVIPLPDNRSCVERCSNDSEFFSDMVEDLKMGFYRCLDSIINGPWVGDNGESWVVFTGDGCSFDEHGHGGKDLAAVYYFKFDPSIHPFTTFVNPNVLVESSSKFGPLRSSTEFDFEVSEGSVLLFPGWLRHRVMKQVYGEPRITVGFNTDLNVERPLNC